MQLKSSSLIRVTQIAESKLKQIKPSLNIRIQIPVPVLNLASLSARFRTGRLPDSVLAKIGHTPDTHTFRLEAESGNEYGVCSLSTCTAMSA